MLRATRQVLAGENPFGVDPTGDLLRKPMHDNQLWSETMFFMVWSPEEQVGIWIHMGVFLEDKALWWAQTFAELPEGVVLVDRSFGRPRDNQGPDTGNLKVTCQEPHKRWRLCFDGAGEMSSTTDLARRVVGAGPAVPFRFDIELTAVSPVYDLHAVLGDSMVFSKDGLHHEQGFSAHGQLQAMGKTWRIDGIGVRDHSCGDRTFGKWGGHVWTYAVWPEHSRALAAIYLWSLSGEPLLSSAMVYENGVTEIGCDFRLTGMLEPGGKPENVQFDLVRADGSFLKLSGNVLHNVTITYGVPNENINGAYYDPQAKPGNGREAALTDESVVSWAWSDGSIGYGHLERSTIPSLLPAPKIPLPKDSLFLDVAG